MQVIEASQLGTPPRTAATDREFFPLIMSVSCPRVRTEYLKMGVYAMQGPLSPRKDDKDAAACLRDHNRQVHSLRSQPDPPPPPGPHQTPAWSQPPGLHSFSAVAVSGWPGPWKCRQQRARKRTGLQSYASFIKGRGSWSVGLGRDWGFEGQEEDR